MRRIAVTGMGMVSPVGNNVADSWDAIVNGKSGVESITTFDVSAFTTQFSASVKNLDISKYIPPKETRRIDPFIQYGIIAGMQAIDDSGLEITDAKRRSIDRGTLHDGQSRRQSPDHRR